MHSWRVARCVQLWHQLSQFSSNLTPLRSSSSSPKHEGTTLFVECHLHRHHSSIAGHECHCYALLFVIFHLWEASLSLSVWVTSSNTNSCNGLCLSPLKSSPHCCRLLSTSLHSPVNYDLLELEMISYLQLISVLIRELAHISSSEIFAE